MLINDLDPLGIKVWITLLSEEPAASEVLADVDVIQSGE